MKFGGYGKRRPGKSLAFVVSLFICVMMLLFGTEAVLPHAEEPGNQPGETKKQEISDKEEKAKQKWEGDTIYCTALGDSIAKGYGGKGQEDLRSYTQFIADWVSE